MSNSNKLSKIDPMIYVFGIAAIITAIVLFIILQDRSKPLTLEDVHMEQLEVPKTYDVTNQMVLKQKDKEDKCFITLTETYTEEPTSITLEINMSDYIKYIGENNNRAELTYTTIKYRVDAYRIYPIRYTFLHHYDPDGFICEVEYSYIKEFVTNPPSIETINNTKGIALNGFVALKEDYRNNKNVTLDQWGKTTWSEDSEKALAQALDLSPYEKPVTISYNWVKE